MKQTFLSLFLVVLITQTNYSQSLHKQKQRKAKTCCKPAVTDTCQGTQSCTISQSSNGENKRAEFSIVPLVICPIADDIYGRILGRALKGIQIAY
jgi:hypothetical protein